MALDMALDDGAEGDLAPMIFEEVPQQRFEAGRVRGKLRDESDVAGQPVELCNDEDGAEYSTKLQRLIENLSFGISRQDNTSAKKLFEGAFRSGRRLVL